MNKIYILIRQYSSYDYVYEENLLAFANKEEADLYAICVNETHEYLVKKYDADLAAWNIAMDKWQLGGHKKKPYDGPRPSEPEPPVNPYDLGNKDFDCYIDYDDNKEPRVHYFINEIDLIQKWEVPGPVTH